MKTFKFGNVTVGEEPMSLKFYKFKETVMRTVNSIVRTVGSITLVTLALYFIAPSFGVGTSVKLKFQNNYKGLDWSDDNIDAGFSHYFLPGYQK